MWTPSDILTDLDLLAVDRLCLTDFGVTALADKRAFATDWISQRVEQAGFKLWQHNIRRSPDAVFGAVGSVYTDYTGAAKSTTDADVPLTTIFAAPSTNALYVGSRDPFKAIYVGVADAYNSLACVSSVSVWTGHWTGVSSMADGTIATTGKAFSGGGLIAFQRPDAWLRRNVNNSLLHWARVTVTSSLTAATVANQLAPVVPSRLTLPGTFYALGLLYQESYGSNRGQWQEKSESFFTKATDALSVALPLMVDEFDVDNDDLVSPSEASSITANPNYLSTWERG